MPDYQEAFEEGLKAARRANAARAEITQVFTDFQNQVFDLAQGKVKIDILDRHKPEDNPFAALALTFQTRKRDTYSAICAYNPSIKDSPVYELATWRISSAGYPCIVSWSGKERHCNDSASLQVCLGELIKEPEVGKWLLALVES